MDSSSSRLRDSIESSREEVDDFGKSWSEGSEAVEVWRFSNGVPMAERAGRHPRGCCQQSLFQHLQDCQASTCNGHLLHHREPRKQSLLVVSWRCCIDKWCRWLCSYFSQLLSWRFEAEAHKILGHPWLVQQPVRNLSEWSFSSWLEASFWSSQRQLSAFSNFRWGCLPVPFVQALGGCSTSCIAAVGCKGHFLFARAAWFAGNNFAFFLAWRTSSGEEVQTVGIRIFTLHSLYCSSKWRFCIKRVGEFLSKGSKSITSFCKVGRDTGRC